jgi:hypothetical protein
MTIFEDERRCLNLKNLKKKINKINKKKKNKVSHNTHVSGFNAARSWAAYPVSHLACRIIRA